jgi:preprotein translocase subunit Sec61beta
MADNKIRMPSSGAGLTTFYEDSGSKILLSPKFVLAVIAIIIIAVILLNTL